jgi:hypothetical protein
MEEAEILLRERAKVALALYPRRLGGAIKAPSNQLLGTQSSVSGCAMRWRSTRSKWVVVGLQQGGFTRQMEVPEAGDPETQGAGTQLGVEQFALGGGQWTHGLVGRKHGLGALGIMWAPVA